MKIKLDGISKEYANKGACVKALDNVSLDFDGAELVLITGENGCGKSTLLNIIGGLDSPSSGSLTTDGGAENPTLRKRAENTAYIFQTSNLIATLTVRQNIAVVAGKDARAVDDAIEKTGLSGLADRMPHELSIGQQQRACIARAIVKNDPVLLADEPTSSLDPGMRKEIADLLTDIAKDRLVIVVTHYPEDFDRADRHISMSGGKVVSDERIRPARPCKAKEKSVKGSGKAILQSTLTRTRKHVFRFAINLLMLLVGLICIVINQSAFSYSEEGKNYRQVLANDYILVKSDNFEALGREYRPVYGEYLWLDFPDNVAERYTAFVDGIENDYYKAYALYTPYFMDVEDIGDKKLVAGRMPQAQDEIVINKYLADVYIRFYEEQELNSYDDVTQKAVLTSYDYGVPVQQNPVFRIVGVTDDDLSAYERLKSTSTPMRDLSAVKSASGDNYGDAQILFGELLEYLTLGGGAVYATDCGAVQNSVNAYYNDNIEWSLNKNDVAAKRGSQIINLGFEGATGLDGVKIYGSDEGVVVNFDYLSDLSYQELCGKYDDAADVEREILYVLDKYAGDTVYFSMQYMSLKKNESVLDIISNPFSDTYYFDCTLPLTGVYIPQDSYFGSGGLFAQGGTANVCGGAVLLSDENYKTLNKLYNTPPGCGLAFVDVSDLRTEDDVKEQIEKNDNVTEYDYRGSFALAVNSDRISVINIVALAVGVAMLLFSLIFVLYSLSQYFKQHSGDLGILMSLGKSKLYCGLFMLGEYVFMTVIALVLSVPALFAVPAVLNALISGIATRLRVFVPSGFAFLYVLAYVALVSILAVAGVVVGINAKTPIERIKDRS